jgi:hypothetical protein
MILLQDNITRKRGPIPVRLLHGSVMIMIRQGWEGVQPDLPERASIIPWTARTRRSWYHHIVVTCVQNLRRRLEDFAD